MQKSLTAGDWVYWFALAPKVQSDSGKNLSNPNEDAQDLSIQNQKPGQKAIHKDQHSERVETRKQKHCIWHGQNLHHFHACAQIDPRYSTTCTFDLLLDKYSF